MKWIIAAMAAACVLATAPVALASGNGGSSGMLGLEGQERAVLDRQPEDPVQEAFNRGRRVFRREIVCRNCPYPGGIDGREAAQGVLAQVAAGEIELDAMQAESLTVYLQRRFEIQR